MSIDKSTIAVAVNAIFDLDNKKGALMFSNVALKIEKSFA
jgi:hypothetical protein